MKVLQTDKIGFNLLYKSDQWTIANKKYENESIGKLQRHKESDEAFLLLKGHSIIITKHGSKIMIEKMEIGKVYLVKKDEWHLNVLKENSEVFIIENSDVNENNTENMTLTEEELSLIVKTLEND